MGVGRDRAARRVFGGPGLRPIDWATRWSWSPPTVGSSARSSFGRRSGPKSVRSSPTFARPASSTSGSSRAITTAPRRGSPSRSGWIATSPRSFPPIRPTTSRSSRQKGRTVCFVGDGINDSIALKKADVSISLRSASSIATDTAKVIFLEGGLSRLCELRDIARNLDRNVNRSWAMIRAPNVTNMIGVFTMGFGIMASVATNNVSALAALANGLLPLRKMKRPGNEIGETTLTEPLDQDRSPQVNRHPAPQLFSRSSTNSITSSPASGLNDFGRSVEPALATTKDSLPSSIL